jgi:hypothetical protein
MYKGAYLGDKHESLPNHEGGKDNHGQIQYLKEQLTLILPEFFQLQHLLVNHVFYHFKSVNIDR